MLDEGAARLLKKAVEPQKKRKGSKKTTNGSAGCYQLNPAVD
jgi:hypothetical protein